MSGTGGSGGGAGTAGSEADGGPDPGMPDGPSPPDRTPDAENSCTVDNDCGPTGHCLDLKCVACTEDLHCTAAPDKKKCSPARTCVQCLANEDCNTPPNMSRPFCNPANACVECMTHTDCKTADRPLCAAGSCVACNAGGGSAACTAKNMALPVCLDAAGTCVQCGTSMDCKIDASPVCLENKCAPCTTDAQCAAKDGGKPGICLTHQNGRCATDAETLYVKNANPCSTAGTGGTIEMPFCQPQRAVAAIAANRRVIRVSGPAEVGPVDITQATGGPITIIGQDQARIFPNAEIGIHVRAGDVYVRRLDVVGGRATGVVVDNGATVRLNGVIVEGNLSGGLAANPGAGFDIANSVFALNGIGMVASSTYGGVFLGAPAGGRPGRFRASTIVNNKFIGAVCQNAAQRLDGVLLFGNMVQEFLVCTLATNSKSGEDPRFARPYHLGMDSPCRDAVTSTDFPREDLDGEPRPSGARHDCGADEFQAAQP
jgi:hypothetical protein